MIIGHHQQAEFGPPLWRRGSGDHGATVGGTAVVESTGAGAVVVCRQRELGRLVRRLVM